MSTSTEAASLYDEGATVVITHQVRGDRHAEYEAWLEEISPLCRASTGSLDWHIVRPIKGLSETYTIIVRFDTQAHLQGWMGSETRRRLIEKVRPLLVVGDAYSISSGLDFWFTPPGSRAKIPIRWKQYLVTWSAIYPLALGVPLVVLPVLRLLGLPANHYVDALVVSGSVVALMVYLVMPNYTKLIKGWLYK